MPSLENIRAARIATDRAGADFRALCVEALDDHPLRQVAIAAGVSRDTLYAWKLQASQDVARDEIRAARTATPDTEETQP